jgi:hypothetical protein
MKKQSAKIFFFLILTVFYSMPAFADQIAVIVEKSYPADQIPLPDVIGLYLGQKEMVQGVRMHPINQETNQPINEAFMKKVLHWSPDAYKALWKNKVYRDGGLTPEVKSSSADVIKGVKEKTGAIGYVWQSEANNIPGIKIILTIDLP